MILFTFSAFLVLVLFPVNIALASISILAVGDSFNAIFGLSFGKKAYFLNKQRNIEGVIFAILLSTLASWLFVPFFQAFIASFIIPPA